jgi:hypothetical protein
MSRMKWVWPGVASEAGEFFLFNYYVNQMIYASKYCYYARCTFVPF